MRLPKWLRRRKKKNPFEASLLIDNPDIKVVEARYKKDPFFIGIGASKQREVKGAGEVALPKGVKGEYQSQKDLKWSLYFNPNALPTGFMPEEKLRDFVASTVSAVSGSTEVYAKETEFIETERETLEEEKKVIEKVAEKESPWADEYFLNAFFGISEQKSWDEAFEKRKKKE